MHDSDCEVYWLFLQQSLRWEQHLHVCLWAVEYSIGEFDQNKTHTVYPQVFKLCKNEGDALNCPWLPAMSQMTFITLGHSKEEQKLGKQEKKTKTKNVLKHSLYVVIPAVLLKQSSGRQLLKHWTQGESLPSELLLTVSLFCVVTAFQERLS